MRSLLLGMMHGGREREGGGATTQPAPPSANELLDRVRTLAPKAVDGEDTVFASRDFLSWSRSMSVSAQKRSFKELNNLLIGEDSNADYVDIYLPKQNAKTPEDRTLKIAVPDGTNFFKGRTVNLVFSPMFTLVERAYAYPGPEHRTPDLPAIEIVWSEGSLGGIIYRDADFPPILFKGLGDRLDDKSKEWHLEAQAQRSAVLKSKALNPAQQRFLRAFISELPSQFEEGLLNVYGTEPREPAAEGNPKRVNLFINQPFGPEEADQIQTRLWEKSFKAEDPLFTTITGGNSREKGSYSITSVELKVTLRHVNTSILGFNIALGHPRTIPAEQDFGKYLETGEVGKEFGTSEEQRAVLLLQTGNSFAGGRLFGDITQPEPAAAQS